MKTADIHWLAGLLEGEGWFGAQRKGSGSPVLTMTMVDRDVVERAARILGLDREILTYPPRRDEWSQIYRVTIGGKKAVGWMMTLYPLMGIRRQEQIRDVLTQWRQIPVANGQKTHCPRGHPYDEANTIYGQRGHYILRRCRTCKNEGQRERRMANGQA